MAFLFAVVFSEVVGSKSNLAKLRNDIHNSKEAYDDKLTTKFCQLKTHRTTDGDFAGIIQNFHEIGTVEPVLHRIKLIEDQWRTLALWELVQSVNPRPVIEFGRDKLFKREFALLENKDDMIFRWSIVLCNIFEDLMRTLGWKVGKTSDIEEDICDVVGQLLMKVEKQDRSSLLDCMQSAMVNIQIQNKERNSDKLRMLKKEEYNGLNLACILLDQMILDNKDNTVSWMRTVCLFIPLFNCSLNLTIVKMYFGL